MTLHYKRKPNDQRGYVDVIERNGETLAKWHFRPETDYTPVKIETKNRHYFNGAPLEKTFTFGGWRFWFCDIVK